jgi:hypothetical protein
VSSSRATYREGPATLAWGGTQLVVFMDDLPSQEGSRTMDLIERRGCKLI